MWPFQKKTAETLPEKKKSLLFNDLTFNQFGSYSVTWDNFITNVQNDKMLVEAYNTLSELSSPINKFAQDSKNVIPEFFVDGKVFNEKSPLYIPFLNYWNEQIDLAIIYKLLLGKLMTGVLEFGTVETGINNKTPQYFYTLPSQNTTIKLVSNQDFRMQQIEMFRVLNDNNQKYTDIPANLVSYQKYNNPIFYNNAQIYGISPLVSCAKNIQAIRSGYSAKVGLYEHGPQVIVTGKAQGEFASMNANADETNTQLQDRFNNRYGMTEGQYRFMVTQNPLDVNVISMDIGQLQINENNKADFQKICSALDIPSIILSDDTGNTFSNKEQAESAYYNGSFKRLIDNVCANYTPFINRFDNRNIVVKPNYSKIAPIMNEQRKHEASLLEECEKGLMTRNQYFEQTKKDRVELPEFDQYATFINGIWTNVSAPIQDNQDNLKDTGISQEQLQAQANLRGSVGGVQGILAIQTSVSMGTSDYSAAIATLVEIYGFSEDKAKLILGTPKKPINNTSNGTENI